MTSVEVGEFKGHPVITLRLDEGDQYGFTFGLGKARLILECIEDIQKFVEENEYSKAYRGK